MPFSFHTFDNVIRHFANALNPKMTLDIGCGAGKYADIIRENTRHTRLTGIEPESTYIDRFDLANRYDDLRHGRAEDILYEHPSETFDLAIIGDVIEHMPKSTGLDLLNFLTYRTQYILVLAPEFIIQHEVDGVREEAHVSVWSERDFHWHDLWAWDNCWVMGLYLLRGYLPSALTLRQAVDSINSSALELTAADTDRVVRHADLKLVSYTRDDRKPDGSPLVVRPQ